MSGPSTSNLFSSGGSGGEAIQETGREEVRSVGRSNVSRVRSNLFPGMDTKRALFKAVDVHVTADNRMSDAEAGKLTLNILARCGLSTEDDAIMVGFVKAMCLCMAINSSSTLVPGRAKMYVAGGEFDFFADVMAVLGNDARRYFRAYADVTRDYLREIIASFKAGPRSEDKAGMEAYDHVCDMYEAIKLVAEKRGLLRVMDLIHDSAEYCSNKTAVERMFLMQSKATIFASGAYSVNTVDHPVVNKPSNSKPVGAVVTSGDGMPDGY